MVAGGVAGLLVSLGIFGLGQVFAAQAARHHLARGLGLFAANSHGQFCLSIDHGELKPGQEIILVWVPLEGEPDKPEIRREKIRAKLAEPCDAINQPAGESNYRLHAGKVDSARIYIAMAVRPANLRVAGREVTARLGGQELTFRACTSSEGVHFSAWPGLNPTDKPLWHRYYYLGYDVEPTCAERDFIKEVAP